MHVVLHLAVSQDGFIARTDGDSDWVSPVDGKLFDKRARDAGCLVVGNTTFKQYKGTIYPVANVFNIVMSASEHGEDDGVVYVMTPQQAIEVASERGYGTLLVAGGGKTSAAFLDAGLVDEIFLSIHPIQLHEGIKSPGDLHADPRYTLAQVKNLEEGIIEEHYTVL